jgi:uncharacterized protein (DUF2126 family)
MSIRFDSRLEDPLERARLAKVFEQGLTPTHRHVLPIARTPDGDRWQTDRGSCAASAAT